MSDTDNNTVEKKSSILKILIPVVLVVAILAGTVVANASRIKNFLQKSFMSTTDYYQSVEKAGIDSVASMYANRYDDMLYTLGGIDNKSCNIDVNVKVEDAAAAYTSLIGSFIGAKVDWIKQAGISANISSSGGEYGLTGRVTLNDVDIAGLNAAYVSDSRTAYAGIPELSSKYISYKDDSGIDYKGIIKTIDSLVNELPDKSAIEEIIVKYGGIIVNNIDNVQKEDSEITVGDITQSCTEYTASIDSGKLKNMAVELLDALSSDENIKLILTKNYDAIMSVLKNADSDFLKEITRNLPDMSGETLYSSMIAVIDQLKSSINNSTELEDMGIEPVMSVYIDGSGNVIGRTLTVDDLVLSYRMPVKGSDYAMDMSIGKIDGEAISVIGNGSISGGKMSGDFNVSIPQYSLLNEAGDGLEEMSFQLKDVDIDMLYKGYFNGVIRYDLGDMLRKSGASAIDGLMLDYGIKSGRDKSSVEMGLYMGERRLVTLTVDMSLDKVRDIIVPQDSDAINVNDGELRNWLTTVNLDSVINSFEKAGMDDSMLEYVKQFNSLLSLGI